MNTIFKYALRLSDHQSVSIKKGGVIRSVQMQNGSLCMWAEVDSNAEEETRHFEIFGTGHGMNPDVTRVYIGSVQAGQFVWHVFERITR